MSQIILAIDDHPENFRKLKELLIPKNIVIITTCRYPDITEYLKGPDQIIGICLDFDMPFGTGAFYVTLFKNIKIPIVITEKDVDGSNRVLEALLKLNYDVNLSSMIPAGKYDWDLGIPKGIKQSLINGYPEQLIKILPNSKNNWEIEAMEFFKLAKDFEEDFIP